MPKQFGPAQIRFLSFAAAFVLSPALFAQGGHGGGGYGGAHSSPLSYGSSFRGGNAMGAPLAGAHYGIGSAVVPPVASSSGHWYVTTGNGAYPYGNRPYNLGSGHRRYPYGYMPYYVAAYPYLYFGDSGLSTPPESYGPPPQQQDQPNNDLAMELDSIHQELAVLQQRQAPPPYGMAPADAGPLVEQAPSKPLDPPLVLVFRDGTRTEIRDFAVVGQTFWDLSVRPIRKFPVSQLNLDASIKANEDRGVDFPSVARPQ
jgi:hypothetical protein